MKIPTQEQLDWLAKGRKGRSWFKRSMNRRKRRQAKLHPEDAMIKNYYRGWYS